MLEDFKRLWRLLSARARRGLLLLILMLACGALLELAAVGLITRFMGEVVDAPEPTAPLTLYPDHPLPLWQAALLTLSVFAASNFLLGFSSWRLARYIWEQEVDLSCRVFEAVLRMPYRQFLSRNSGTLHEQIWCEQLCRGFLFSSLLLLSKGLSCAFLLVGVVYADWRAATFAIFAVLVVYTFLHALLSGPVTRLGADHWQAQSERQRLTTETLSAYKSVKLMQRWQGLLVLYREAARKSASRSGAHEMMTEVPRYVLETTALAGLVGMALYRIYLREGNIIAMVSLYGIAGYRILPAVHIIFRLFSQLRFHRSSVQETAELLETEGKLPDQPGPALDRQISLENVRIQFPARLRPALDGVSLTIKRGQLVGLAGTTGSGKSTLLDVFSGLLALDEGRLLIDDQPLAPEKVVDWQRRLGFLPQTVETLDDSLAANICFGLERNEERLQQVVSQAELEEFVAELPGGLETRVGERGSFLSSGQRQRLGLARALYHNPGVLLLDEATSSLDGKTEEALLSTLSSYRGEKTILMAAHRATALAICDHIYLLEAGQIVEQGRYEDLASHCPRFQQLLAIES